MCASVSQTRNTVREFDLLPRRVASRHSLDSVWSSSIGCNNDALLPWVNTVQRERSTETFSSVHRLRSVIEVPCVILRHVRELNEMHRNHQSGRSNFQRVYFRCVQCGLYGTHAHQSRSIRSPMSYVQEISCAVHCVIYSAEQFFSFQRTSMYALHIDRMIMLPTFAHFLDRTKFRAVSIANSFPIEEPSTVEAHCALKLILDRCDRLRTATSSVTNRNRNRFLMADEIIMRSCIHWADARHLLKPSILRDKSKN